VEGSISAPACISAKRRTKCAPAGGSTFGDGPAEAHVDPARGSSRPRDEKSRVAVRQRVPRQTPRDLEAEPACGRLEVGRHEGPEAWVAVVEDVHALPGAVASEQGERCALQVVGGKDAQVAAAPGRVERGGQRRVDARPGPGEPDERVER
jgi:hypothetical protein